jgi:urea transporter
VRRKSQVPQITSAMPSRMEELRHREVRYALMMGFRIVCLVAATVMVEAHVPHPVFWAPALILGAVLIPWFAVILANDRGPLKRQPYRPHRPEPPAQRAITTSEPDAGPRTIDVDLD